jgi:hypothetical protein
MFLITLLWKTLNLCYFNVQTKFHTQTKIKQNYNSVYFILYGLS